VANIDGSWQLIFRETKSELIGLLAKAVEYLNTHQTAVMHQLGGARNFGGGLVDCELVNPLYEANEFHRASSTGVLASQRAWKRKTRSGCSLRETEEILRSLGVERFRWAIW